jgi:DNA-binding HxlR family transcriptional regulator
MPGLWQRFILQEPEMATTMNTPLNRSSFTCPISNMLKVASAKWTVEILRECAIRPTRTRQFLRRIPGLSMKCLQERLKELESFGMLDRLEYQENVPRVEHRITERGRRLMKVLVALKELADEISPSGCDCPFESLAFGGCDAGSFCPLSREDSFRSPRNTPAVCEND